MEEDIKTVENIILEYSTQVEDYKFFSVPVRLDERDIEALENLLKRYKQIEQELNSVKEIYYTEAEVEKVLKKYAYINEQDEIVVE